MEWEDDMAYVDISEQEFIEATSEALEGIATIEDFRTQLGAKIFSNELANVEIIVNLYGEDRIIMENVYLKADNSHYYSEVAIVGFEDGTFKSKRFTDVIVKE